MRVTVEEYNPLWADKFQDIKKQLENALQGVPYISIEHVGSTSVPGLAAKPIIDIDIIIKETQPDLVKQALIDRGGYVFEGDMGVPLRYAFRKRADSPIRNLYVCIEGCQSLQNHLSVRDLCRSDPQVRDAYGRRSLSSPRKTGRMSMLIARLRMKYFAWILEKAGWTISDRNNIKDVNTSTPNRR